MFKHNEEVSVSCSVPNSLYVVSQSTLWSNHSVPFPVPCFPAVDKHSSCHVWSPYLSDMFLFKSFLTSHISHLALFPLRFCLVFCPDFAHCIVYHSAVCPRLSRVNTEPSLSHTCAFVPLWCISWHKTEASDQHALWTCLYVVPSEHREKAGPMWVERGQTPWENSFLWLGQLYGDGRPYHFSVCWLVNRDSTSIWYDHVTNWFVSFKIPFLFLCQSETWMYS